MKRVKNIWQKVISPECALLAISEGTKYKRKQRSVERLLCSDDETKWHEIDKEKAKAYADYLIGILNAGIWKHQLPKHRLQYCKSKSSKKGKWRDLYIPSLDDHIIAHMLMIASMEAFTRGMHPHCCGSVPGRGIKHVQKTVENWMKNDRQCRYFVKLDIRKFFDSIDGELLKQTLRRKIGDEKVLECFDQIIDSAPSACPVGYYTSPWLANLFLEDLDWFVEQNLYKERRGKRIKFVRHYLRYVDDILLIGTSETDLRKAINSIKEKLAEKGLEIKPQWEIKRIGKHEVVDEKRRMKPGTYWCDIGGYKFCKDATVMRDGIYLETKRLAKQMHKQGYYKEHQCRTMMSDLGWVKHSDSKGFMKNDILPYVNIEKMKGMISDVDKNTERRRSQAEKS